MVPNSQSTPNFYTFSWEINLDYSDGSYSDPRQTSYNYCPKNQYYIDSTAKTSPYTDFCSSCVAKGTIANSSIPDECFLGDRATHCYNSTSKTNYNSYYFGLDFIEKACILQNISPAHATPKPNYTSLYNYTTVIMIPPKDAYNNTPSPGYPALTNFNAVTGLQFNGEAGIFPFTVLMYVKILARTQLTCTPTDECDFLIFVTKNTTTNLVKKAHRLTYDYTTGIFKFYFYYSETLAPITVSSLAINFELLIRNRWIRVSVSVIHYKIFLLIDTTNIGVATPDETQSDAAIMANLLEGYNQNYKLMTLEFTRGYFMLIERIFVFRAFIDTPFDYSMSQVMYRTDLNAIIHADATDIDDAATVSTTDSTPVLVSTKIKSLYNIFSNINGIYPVVLIERNMDDSASKNPFAMRPCKVENTYFDRITFLCQRNLT